MNGDVVQPCKAFKLAIYNLWYEVIYIHSYLVLKFKIINFINKIFQMLQTLTSTRIDDITQSYHC